MAKKEVESKKDNSLELNDEVASGEGEVNRIARVTEPVKSVLVPIQREKVEHIPSKPPDRVACSLEFEIMHRPVKAEAKAAEKPKVSPMELELKQMTPAERKRKALKKVPSIGSMTPGKLD